MRVELVSRKRIRLPATEYVFRLPCGHLLKSIHHCGANEKTPTHIRSWDCRECRYGEKAVWP